MFLIEPTADDAPEFLGRVNAIVDPMHNANLNDLASFRTINPSAENVALSSDERIAISTTEILSYLVFGAPTFALGQENSAAINQAIAALLPTVALVSRSR